MISTLCESGFTQFLKENLLLTILIGVCLVLIVVTFVSVLIRGLIKKQKSKRPYSGGVVAPPTPKAVHTPDFCAEPEAAAVLEEEEVNVAWEEAPEPVSSEPCVAAEPNSRNADSAPTETEPTAKETAIRSEPVDPAESESHKTRKKKKAE